MSNGGININPYPQSPVVIVPDGTVVVKGPPGPLGPVGPIGPIGPQGIQGIQGPIGPLGPVGPMGPQGTQGFQGIQGNKGDKGDKGDRGNPGAYALPNNTGTAVAIGDSITAAGVDDSSYYRRPSWFSIACMVTGQRLTYIRNASTAGQSTGQMLARFDTDVLPHYPRYCFIMGGRNDIDDVPVPVPDVQIRQNLADMVNRCKDNSIIPIMCTIPPRDNDIKRERTNALNFWIKSYGRKTGVMVMDFYSLCVNPANGNWKPFWGVDGIHPDYNAMGEMGRYAAAQMMPILPVWSPYLTKTSDDPINMIKNGTFATDTGGIPTNWTVDNAAGASDIKCVEEPFVSGRAVQIYKGGSGYFRLQQDITTGYSVGDKIVFSGKVITNEGDKSINNDVHLQFVGTTTYAKLIADGQVGFREGGVWCMELIVPAGTTAIRAIIELGGGSGTCRYGEVTLINITKHGAP